MDFLKTSAIIWKKESDQRWIEATAEDIHRTAGWQQDPAK